MITTTLRRRMRISTLAISLTNPERGMKTVRGTSRHVERTIIGVAATTSGVIKAGVIRVLTVRNDEVLLGR